MSDTEKSIDRCIARLHLRRAMRPYRSSRAFVLLVILPGDTGEQHWKSAAYDVLKQEASHFEQFDWRRAGRGDLHVDIFDTVEMASGKEPKADPWGSVTYGDMRTVLICRRKDADIVRVSKLSALADAIIDIAELDLKLVQRAVKTTTGDDISPEDAAEILSLPNDVRDALRKTGRGIANVLRRIRMHETVPADAGTELSKKLQGPMLHDMHGYGAAKDWGLELARDLEDYAAGIITWDDVDSGLLLSGPPGCGKTTFAQALANSCGVELVIGSYSTWQSAGHQGDMLKAMVKTFDRARGKAPCSCLSMKWIRSPTATRTIIIRTTCAAWSTAFWSSSTGPRAARA